MQMSKPIDMNGKKFARLTIIKQADYYINPTTGKKTLKWECLCDCGNKTIVLGSSLRKGATTSCGCKRLENLGKVNLANRKEFGESSFNQLYSGYKYAAKKRNHVFELDKKQFRKLITKNCTICKSPPNSKRYSKTSHGEFIYNGIDRIDNDEGYIISNVRTLCKLCNYAKGSLTEIQFQEWLDRIRGIKCK